jgi:hypothetical protein
MVSVREMFNTAEIQVGHQASLGGIVLSDRGGSKWHYYVKCLTPRRYKSLSESLSVAQQC